MLIGLQELLIAFKHVVKRQRRAGLHEEREESSCSQKKMQIKHVGKKL